MYKKICKKQKKNPRLGGGSNFMDFVEINEAR